ncbi:MAG TPA: CRISPR-associated endonuclease Cas3'', partial [Candidatus Saccharimonadales bacterium]|nr:CRISPR-associated endonuclease Cas3'' [Candidatus Saccharimonadales bacterium]
MKFFAHTAEDDQGNRLPEDKWQPLSEHLRNVALLAKEFGAPLCLAAEAEQAGLLHDLGKYAERFQARLRNPAIHGINHWAAGAVRASTMKAWAAAFAVDGHHTGIPALNDNTAGIPLRQTVAQFNSPQTRSELTGQCPESLDELLDSLTKDKLQVPSLPARPIVDWFAEALRTRMLFSCLVDADFLDTEQHFNAAQAGLRAIPELQSEQALAALQRDLQAKSSDGAVNAL